MWQWWKAPKTSQNKDRWGIWFVFKNLFSSCVIFKYKKDFFFSLQVLHSPFDDIIPRDLKKPKKEKEEDKKSQSKATKWVFRIFHLKFKKGF